MAWQMRSKTSSIITATTVARRTFSLNGQPFKSSPFSAITDSFTSFHRSWPSFTAEKLRRVNNTWLGLSFSHQYQSNLSFGADAEVDDVFKLFGENQVLRFSNSSIGLAQELANFKVQNVPKTDVGLEFFDEMKQRFLKFKKYKYLEEVEHFQALSEVQSPKFMVIACVDSRVCPSNILGFQPGEAFMVRNVANLVPPLENGPTETNAALEFAVNTLEVQNIFVIGHSSCAGIEALMTMQDEKNSSFIEKWVANAKTAKFRTKADAIHLSFDQQCKHCEKESINCSLVNLLTYPWIEDKARKGLLFLHGGYYDFMNCTFEKWSLNFEGSGMSQDGRFSITDRDLWC